VRHVQKQSGVHLLEQLQTYVRHVQPKELFATRDLQFLTLSQDTSEHYHHQLMSQHVFQVRHAKKQDSVTLRAHKDTLELLALPVLQTTSEAMGNAYAACNRF
jgi:hypothetical protein